MGLILFHQPLQSCTCICSSLDSSEWLCCSDDGARQGASPKTSASRTGGGGGGSRRRQPKGAPGPNLELTAKRIEDLTRELFAVHDLNGNNLLEEQELVSLNEKIAVLHHGQEANTQEVRAKYKALFRAKLDPHGQPVAYAAFRSYAMEVLDGLDPDPEAQELILEQFVAEARSACQALPKSLPPSLLGDPEEQLGVSIEDLIELEAEADEFMPLPGSIDMHSVGPGIATIGRDGL
mmetsp:Transcript_34682/g.91564  ORF Transcript_34682/g.91564 Transcript_34682/m.91564 type:complete len:236 (-) Transcript_34682:320-1027(-)